MAIAHSNQSNLHFFLKWLISCSAIGFIVGSICAFFLFSLNWVTQYREAHPWIIYGLPLAGFAIALSYKYWGNPASKGNNLLIEEYLHPQRRIPLIMAPLVLFGTLLTHLFGGSAGREGTAVQIGGAVSDQLNRLFDFDKTERRILISIGITAGFAAVFGTPLAGTIFGLEVLLIGKKRYFGILPCLFTAYFANFSCQLWNIPHTHYPIHDVIPMLSLTNIGFSFAAGILFGITAWLFTFASDFFSLQFKRIKYPLLRPVIGGIILVLIITLFHSSNYIGLGIPMIQNAFVDLSNYYDFIIKLLLTTFTLSAGFKGGEVTPLFFIGATLGSALSTVIPLPISLLAAMGFVAVFSGATNTPLACIVMGYELFGIQPILFIAIACIVAFLFSGKKGIYIAQKGGLKEKLYRRLNL
ncbi:voltage-gated chloride channel family protein [Sphingobacterium siyangense]|uniref:voltage-gated chloride channel family protein n=1 Tax=Sphingobacterium siyangense TaxID=459529 RepID=UPI001963E200|nr:voltage-gated chloride channel family protein [Sphingobacterium siyangense]QRY60177.1 voltage-gated chloride channel family protein [Sphingobacterium siyangense]